MIHENIKKFLVDDSIKVKDAMEILSELGCKILFVHKNYKLKASLTDGDIRRYILDSGNIENTIKDVANYNPKYLINAKYDEAVDFMQMNQIDAIPILNNDLMIENIYFLNYRLKNDYDLKINIPVVMMAGGKGTRLYPYTKILPKPLIPIGDIPIAERIINKFNEVGCKDFYLVVNHKKNMIKSYFNEINKEYNINYIDEDMPLGTGGGLYYLKGLIKETFILTNCDILINYDFSKILNYHISNKNIITMVVASQNIQVPYGVVEFDNENSIISMKEKPQISYYTNTGCYIVESSVLDYIKDNENIGFPDIVKRCMDNNKKVAVYPVPEDAFMDMGELDKLNHANNIVL